jgi:hypothetical protein
MEASFDLRKQGTQGGTLEQSGAHSADYKAALSLNDERAAFQLATSTSIGTPAGRSGMRRHHSRLMTRLHRLTS